MLNSAATITLPNGLWLDGVRHQQVAVRSLAGDDEAFLQETSEFLLPAQRVTALLTRCVSFLGPLSPVSIETIRRLTVGDREALLLHVRRLTLGERMQCVLSCPHPQCGEKMDLELKVSQLLVAPYSHARERFERSITVNGTVYQVRFRTPTGADQEATAELAHGDVHAATNLMLRRCVEQVTTGAEPSSPGEDWPPAVAQQLPAMMAELDPQAELLLNLSCPACSHAFSTLFDTATFLIQELARRAGNLYREVHLLAFYYHWSEAEIMGMTAAKRHRYLDLLVDALSEEGRR